MKRNIEIYPRTCTGALDSRYLRSVSIYVIILLFSVVIFKAIFYILFKVNVPALGFSPKVYTPPLAHAHNEFIQADTFLNGIKVFEKIIKALCNI